MYGGLDNGYQKISYKFEDILRRVANIIDDLSFRIFLFLYLMKEVKRPCPWRFWSLTLPNHRCCTWCLNRLVFLVLLESCHRCLSIKCFLFDTTMGNPLSAGFIMISWIDSKFWVQYVLLVRLFWLGWLCALSCLSPLVNNNENLQCVICTGMEFKLVLFQNRQNILFVTLLLPKSVSLAVSVKWIVKRRRLENWPITYWGRLVVWNRTGVEMFW